MFTAFKRDLLVIRNTNPTVPQLKCPVLISRMHGQVLKAESRNFYIQNHFLRFFYHYDYFSAHLPEALSLLI